MYSYEKQLETLILGTLLPVYIRAEQAKGKFNPLNNIHPDLLKQIKQKAKLPALLRPKEGKQK